MWSEITGTPVFGISITLIAYVCSLFLHRRWPILHPLLLTSCVLIAFLLATETPYKHYSVGGDVLALFLGPATIALGVPLYKYFQRFRKSSSAILISITIGSLTGLTVAGVSIWLLQGDHGLLASMMPKSTTTPIAVEITRRLGGIPELAAVLAVLTGLLGSVCCPRFLRLAGIRKDLPLGIAMGTASHGIGTSRMIRESEYIGGASALAMALTGIITSILVIPLIWWFS